ncbi:hypothetical protein V7S43_017022 [Phytophthora oleae]|uniref:Uncharacterized protein n=1 Tax=Phytophthora oleae TaxID=2107226 RepID=A0ABD3ETY5_9STRA
MTAPPAETPFQYHQCDESAFTVGRVMEVTCDEAACALWCMEVGLIDKAKLCPLCNSSMKLSFARKRWRCCRRAQHAEGKKILIGGDGHIVAIDETSLAKKRKYNRGRYYQEY